jgi:hypothetical protein
MHFLSSRELPADIFADTDVVLCRVYGRESMNWSFVPVNVPKEHPNWFQLQFDLPPEVAPLVRAAGGAAVEVAHLKHENFSFISLAGLIGGVRRQVMLQLDEDWIADYMRRALDAA